MQSSGTQVITADGVVGTSGSPVRIFAIHILSGAGGAAVVALRNGTAVSGTIWVQETGNSNAGATFNYGVSGMFFPNGCYCDVDTNTTSVAVSYVQQ